MKLHLRRLYAAARQAVGLNRPRGWRILMYHRVIDPERVPYPLEPGMYVRPATFKMQMEYLKQRCNIVPLDELVAAIEEGREPSPGTVAVTFDDGWKDNYENAFPVLRELEIPATIFLATGYISTPKLFWTDELSLVITEARRHSALNREALDEIFHAHGLTDPFHSAWNARADGNSRAQEAFSALLARAKLLPPKLRQQLLTALSAAAPNSSPPPPPAFMSWENVEEMSALSVTFGSHTHSHTPLTELSAEALRSELETSYAALKKHSARITPVLCPPGGYRDRNTDLALKEAGVRRIVGVSPHTDRTGAVSLLGRIGVHEDITSSPAALALRLR